MATRMSFVFPPFRLELSSEQLWREDRVIALRPKTFAVLRYLVEHSGQLVTKDELLDVVWAGTIVSDTVLKSCIRELRLALADDVQTPQFIATVHRRGYRWLAPLRAASPVPRSTFHVQGSKFRHSALSTQDSLVVGRDAELSQLQAWLDKALSGERQLVFVTGEAGIGKTTLIDVFLQRLETGGWRLDSSPQAASLKPLVPGGWVGRGQCIEQYGAGEAYMPILEALGRLCREPGGERLIALLHHHAPTWLVQMPTLLTAPELEALQRKVQGATRERMLREMTEAIDAITAERPLILWLEDLHWSDVSTLELLSLLARRREPTRLLILGTYRPVDVIVSEHPLRTVKQELQLHGHCHELAVRLLSEEHIAQYLAARVQVPSPAPAGEGQGEGQSSCALTDLAHTIHQRTEGNPLFMVTVVDELLTKEQVDSATVEASIPETIRQMIERHLERLSPEEQRILEVASVTGMEFSAAAVAAGTETAIDEVEQRCAALARRGQFLRADGTAEWPDGTITTRYGFLHALYQEVTYARVPMGRRVSLHQCIGERIETAYGKQVSELAAELAVHFEQGRDYRRAVQYLQQAGENATRRSAHQEAISLLTKGLKLLKILPDVPESGKQELGLQRALGLSLVATKGFGAPQTGQAYERARELCQELGETTQLFPVLLGLHNLYNNRGEIQRGRALGEEILQLAQHVQEPDWILAAHIYLGATLYALGDFVGAKEHLYHVVAKHEIAKPEDRALLYGQEPVVVGKSYLARSLWMLGYPGQALTQSQESITLVHDMAHVHTSAFGLAYAASVHALRGDWDILLARAEELIALATEQGLSMWLGMGMCYRGVALLTQGDHASAIELLCQGLTLYQATGARLGCSGLLYTLAEGYRLTGDVKNGQQTLTAAFAVSQATGECTYEAEMWRAKGRLILKQSSVQSLASRVNKGSRSKKTDPRSLMPDAQGKAEACFHKAIDIAQRQQAKSLELRATMSLARLWRSQGKQKEAHKLLADIYGWFTEGFDTKDLQEAKALLEGLL